MNRLVTVFIIHMINGNISSGLDAATVVTSDVKSASFVASTL